MERWRRAMVAAVLLGWAAGAFAGSAPATQPSRAERIAAIRRLSRELALAVRQERWKTARQRCETLIALQPNHPAHHYNLACCFARLGNRDAAMASLGKAVELGWFDDAKMRADPDLAGLRGDERFAALVRRAGAEVPPTTRRTAAERVIEGRPAGALHYRLRIGADATAERPHRLVVWLHPAGGAMNAAAEKLAPIFRTHGFALLVFTRKSTWIGWTGPDARRALRTVEAVDGRADLDAGRPVLFGYSAGGQLALQLWAREPGRLGGLLLDAAYPLDTQAYARGKVQAMAVPRDPAVRTVPILALVGTADGGAAVWKKAQPAWAKAGVPLEVVYVAGAGHTWLFGPEQVKALGDWLGRLRKARGASSAPASTGPAATRPAGGGGAAND